MTEKAQMVIPFKGLKEGLHQFEFVLDKKFFEYIAYSEVSKGNVKAKAELNKHSRMLELDIALSGWVEVICDRCLDTYNQSVKYTSELIVKIGTEKETSDDNIIFITEDDYELVLDHYLYESIILSLPMKKVHPKNKQGEETCNTDALEQLKKYSSVTKKRDDEIDPRWGKLKDLL